MPAKGISLHIGLNYVNPDHYGGWDGELKACEFDARDMQAIASGRDFRPTMLLTREATADAVTSAIAAAAKQLKSGDIFWVTYSGHGGQVPDTNADETDPERQDETWVLWDRQLVDDELWDLWKRFKRGVRVLVFSDSCHSGTVTRVMPAFPLSGPAPRIRLLPPRQAAKVYRQNAELYDDIQKAVPGGERVKVKASVLLISGCQDNQFSLDGNRNGLFTETMKRVWRNGKFGGGYRKFRDTIAQRMPSQQTPNYFVVGRPDSFFEAQAPFTI
jgi:hypothetical protein